MEMDLITQIVEVMGMDMTAPQSILWQSILWQIYYDFYYPLSPTFGETVMAPKFALLSEMEQVQEIIAELKKLPCAGPLLFCLQKITPRSLKVLYLSKGPLLNWLAPFDPKFYHLLRAVKKSHHYNVVYYIHKLFQDGEPAEDIVKVLCDYYKVPFVPTLPCKRSDLQYVLAVYVRFQVAAADAPDPAAPAAPAPAAAAAAADLLPYIAEESPAVIIKNIMLRLKGDPVLIDMKERQVSLAEVGEYMLSCLNTQEEVDLYTGVPTREDGEAVEASAADMNFSHDAFEGLNNTDNILDMVGRRWIKQVLFV